MREFDGFTGIATMARQGWEGDRVRTLGNDVIGADDAPIVEAQAAGKIETTRQGERSVDCSRRKTEPARHWLAPECGRERDEVR
jgi:hypothetical protein